MKTRGESRPGCMIRFATNRGIGNNNSMIHDSAPPPHLRFTRRFAPVPVSPLLRSGVHLSCFVDEATTGRFHVGVLDVSENAFGSGANGRWPCEPVLVFGWEDRTPLEAGRTGALPLTAAALFVKYEDETTPGPPSLSLSLSSMTPSASGAGAANAVALGLVAGPGGLTATPLATSAYSSSSSSSKSNSRATVVSAGAPAVGWRSRGSSSRDGSHASTAVLACFCFRGEFPRIAELLLMRIAGPGLTGGERESWERDEVVRAKVRFDVDGAADSSASLSVATMPRLALRSRTFTLSLWHCPRVNGISR